MADSYGQNCNRCGFCLSVCPTYQAQGAEDASPRARIQLIDFFSDNKIESSEKLKDIISKCLMCGSCANICPSGINHPERYIRMREKMIRDHGDRPEIKSLVYLLAKESRIRMAAGAAKMAQKIVPDLFALKYKLGNIALKQFPVLNKVPFRSAARTELERTPGQNSKGASDLKYGRVAYFTGCATNYLFDDTGFAVLDILHHLGLEVIIPDTQTCCGIPMLYHGGREKIKNNVTTNLACLGAQGIDAVIVDCPTCGAALKNDYPGLAKEFGLDQDRANRVAEKVVDISTFIMNHARPEVFAQNHEAVRVTYHQPCHLRNHMPTPGSAQALLNALKGVEYIPALDMDSCCGGGGTFFYEYPEVSKGIAENKVANAKATGADLWVTDCPVCRINLGGYLDDTADLTVVHPARLAAQFLSALKGQKG
ncbi:(Fe-S)-binding protein [uncultured Desulfobacter sp.]|uniref:(Fe-S)-binding protein n=1 Tax=uncultured Desulfobacter sp. TaxID=240139 RepID=UPI0029F5086B|nr:(Fe-S)-binding protein [uncultured Desulfobacter sp.]